MREYKSPPDPGECYTRLLNRSLIDYYVRENKTGFYYPRKKHKQATGRPVALAITRTYTKQATQAEAAVRKTE